MSVRYFDHAFTFDLEKRVASTFAEKDLVAGWLTHTSGNPLTNLVKDFSNKFLIDDMPAKDALLFVQLVCAWGGTRGRNFELFTESVSKSGRGDDWLRSVLMNARDASRDGDYIGAINAFSETRGLGVSFRSKVLRFLCPDQAAILDLIIRNEIGYADSAKGYEMFMRDCICVRDALNNKKKSA